MGSWYRVTKRISGRLYDYWQRTKRVGKSVKTENKYIGPTSSGNGHIGVASVQITPKVDTPTVSQHERTIAEHHALLSQPKPAYVPPEMWEEPPPVRENYTTEEWRDVLAERRERKREMTAYLKKRDATIRAVKQKTRGIKSVNPFLAQGIKK